MHRLLMGMKTGVAWESPMLTHLGLVTHMGLVAFALVTRLGLLVRQGRLGLREGHGNLTGLGPPDVGRHVKRHIGTRGPVRYGDA